MISVVTNYLAMNAGRQFNIVSKDKNKSVEKLSSGYKINRAADDAAGLSISEKMRHQIRNLNQACDNIQDGISLVHTADGVFEELTSITKRINELCVQAANDTNDEDDRAAIDAEIQELKEEISDTLFNASFNTKRLFSEYYVPEVWGQPPTEDIQVYNDGLGGYGGISINNIRYTWSELGVSFNSDGTYCADTLFPPYGQRDSIRDPITNEAINLCFRAGERPPMASREYHWEATDDGIYVNKLLASTWEDLKGGFNKDDPKAGIYSFNFHGMTVRFATNEGDDFETIKQSLNGQTPNYKNEIYWNASSLFSYDQHAVDIMNPTTSVRIHDTENAGGIYKYDYVDTENFYELRATADGVQLVDISNHGNNDFDTGGKHTLMPWSSFFDASGIPSPNVPTSGNNPIIDWGKENKDNTLDFVTLDDSAVYRYTDKYTGITFDFKLSDEISLEQICNGMTLSLGTIKTSLTAPIETKLGKIIPESNKRNHKITPYINEMSYEFMLQAGRNFDKQEYVFTTSTSFAKTSASEYTYSYGFPNGLNMSGVVSADQVEQNMRDLEFKDTKLKIDLNCNLYGNTGSSDGSIVYEVSSINSIYNKNRLSYAESTSESARVNMNNYLQNMTNGNAYNDIANLRYKVNNAIADMNRRIDKDNLADPADKMPADELNVLRTQLSNYMTIGQKLTNAINTYNNFNDASAITNMIDTNKTYDKIIIKDGIYTDTNKSLTSPDAAYTAFANNRSNAFSALISGASSICSLLDDCEALVGGNEYGILGSIRNLNSTYNRISNYKSQIASTEKEQMNYCNTLKKYKENYIKTLNDSTLTTKCTDFAVSYISKLDDEYTTSVHTVFDATIDDIMPRKQCFIQSGANEGEDTMMEWDCLNLTRIGLGGANSLTREQAVASIARANRALSVINHNRSLFGAYENRLSSQYDNNRNYSENLDQAESKLRDTDMAEEAANYAKHTIIQNAGQAMLSQANQKMSMVINLLQS